MLGSNVTLIIKLQPAQTTWFMVHPWFINDDSSVSFVFAVVTTMLSRQTNRLNNTFIFVTNTWLANTMTNSAWFVNCHCDESSQYMQCNSKQNLEQRNHIDAWLHHTETIAYWLQCQLAIPSDSVLQSATKPIRRGLTISANRKPVASIIRV